MQGVHLRKYGQATTINFDLYEVDGIDLRVDAVHASGDTTIMKDEGAEANTASGFVDEGNGYSLALSATEMEAARVVIYVIDQTGTKVWLDKTIIIETYGHASAQHAFDLDTATASADVVSISGSSQAADNLEESCETILTGTFTGTPTTSTGADSSRTEASDDHFIGRIIVFKGTENTRAAYAASEITDYNGTTKTFTWTAIATAPNAGDSYVIL